MKLFLVVKYFCGVERAERRSVTGFDVPHTLDVRMSKAGGKPALRPLLSAKIHHHQERFQAAPVLADADRQFSALFQKEKTAGEKFSGRF